MTKEKITHNGTHPIITEFDKDLEGSDFFGLEKRSFWEKIKPGKRAVWVLVGWLLGMLSHPLMY